MVINGLNAKEARHRAEAAEPLNWSKDLNHILQVINIQVDKGRFQAEVKQENINSDYDKIKTELEGRGFKVNNVAGYIQISW